MERFDTEALWKRLYEYTKESLSTVNSYVFEGLTSERELTRTASRIKVNGLRCDGYHLPVLTELVDDVKETKQEQILHKDIFVQESDLIDGGEYRLRCLARNITQTLARMTEQPDTAYISFSFKDDTFKVVLTI